MLTLFGSTFLCEHTFSRMKQTKSSQRSRLTDANLHSLLRVAVTNFSPNISKMVEEIQKQILQ